MESGRAGAPDGKGMAMAARATPPARPASFGDVRDSAVGLADRSRHDGGAGGRRETESQCGAQEDRLHHVGAFSRVEAKPNPPRSGIGRVRNYQPTWQKQGSEAGVAGYANPPVLAASKLVQREDMRGDPGRLLAGRRGPLDPRTMPCGGGASDVDRSFAPRDMRSLGDRRPDNAFD